MGDRYFRLFDYVCQPYMNFYLALLPSRERDLILQANCYILIGGDVSCNLICALSSGRIVNLAAVDSEKGILTLRVDSLKNDLLRF